MFRQQFKKKLMSVFLTALLVFYGSLARAEDLSAAEPFPTASENISATAPSQNTVSVANDAVEVADQALSEQAATSNELTGEESTNTNSVTETTTTDVTVDENTGINNGIEFGLITGQNEIGNNTVVTGLETGDIDGTVNLLNLGNSVLGEGSTFASQNILGGDQNITLFSSDLDRVDISAGNFDTGNGSDNTNVLSNNNIVHVFELTDTTVDNTIDILADSGTNIVNNNTKIDDISTGDINLGVNLINLLDVMAPQLELTIDVWNILGDFSGDITVANANTGSESINNNDVNTAANIDIDSEQNTDVSNYFDLSMNTGENEFAENTLVGDVTTGDASSKSNVANISNVNTPMYYILNVFGEWDGNYGGLDPNYVIVNVISEDDASAAADVSVEGSINSETNTTLSNQININANTGRNNVRRNTIVGSMQTGNINVAQNVVNLLNSVDTSLTKFRLGIINIFGCWKHKTNGGGGDGGGNDGGGGGGNEVVPTVQEENVPNLVLGEQRIRSNNLSYLPETGTNLLPSSVRVSDKTSNSSQTEAPVRSPIWGLLAFLGLNIIALAGLLRQKRAN